MLLANLEQMFMLQKVACNLLVVYVGKTVPVYVHASKKAYATLEHAALEKKTIVEIVVKQTGRRYAKKHFINSKLRS